MAQSGFRRGILFAIAAFLLVPDPLLADTSSSQASLGPLALPEEELVLPDGRPLPDLPVRVLGRWDNDDLTVVEWRADLEVKGNAFAGKVSFPKARLLVPLTVQGTRKGDIVEFSVRFRDNEVVYFAGHLAGTSLVGTFEGPAGRRGEWSGSWLPESLEVKDSQ